MFTSFGLSPNIPPRLQLSTERLAPATLSRARAIPLSKIMRSMMEVVMADVSVFTTRREMMRQKAIRSLLQGDETELGAPSTK